MRNLLISLFFTLFILSCKDSETIVLSEGIWLAELAVKDGETLPFNFNLSKNDKDGYFMKIFNADETIMVDEVEVWGDSILIKPPVFEGYILGKFSETEINGSFIKESLERIVPFKATFDTEHRFVSKNPATIDISGVWEVMFSANTPDAYVAKGIFSQNGKDVTGTFRTTTGDYRYLEGMVDGDSVKLSTFDGAHAFLFTTKVTDSTLSGTFFSGNHFKEPFYGKRNPLYELPSEDSLTYLNEGYDKFMFSFPNAKGAMVSLDDPQFENKVVIVQIMGTWCPNCLDETKFLVDFIKNNNSKDLEVVALAFEYARTPEAAFKSIERLRSRVGVEYPILLAQYGTSDKKEAQKKLPMLNHVLSYPTTLILDKKGGFRKIHTGFNGPATGDKYDVFKKEFTGFVDQLLKE